MTKEDWGLLGRNDYVNESEQFTNSIFSGFGGGMLGKMIEGTMKMLEKEMQKELKNVRTQPRTNVELFVNGKRINLNSPNQKTTQKKVLKMPQFSEENLKRISKLPKKEPTANMRRLADSIVYEIDLPGVQSIDALSMIRLENSIEIKAVSGNNAYVKIIPIRLPLRGYQLSNEKLILELGTR